MAVKKNSETISTLPFKLISVLLSVDVAIISNFNEIKGLVQIIVLNPMYAVGSEFEVISIVDAFCCSVNSLLALHSAAYVS